MGGSSRRRAAKGLSQIDFEALGAQVTMPTFMFGSLGTGTIETLFSFRSTLQRWLDMEAALAISEARLGIIPAAAAREISRRATVDGLSIEVFRHVLAVTNHPILALVDALKVSCEPAALGEWIHYGVTTQDIVDTAFALQIKESSLIFEEELRRLLQSLLWLAAKHKRTVMAARTHHTQAAPTTFGFKVAGLGMGSGEGPREAQAGA